MPNQVERGYNILLLNDIEGISHMLLQPGRNSRAARVTVKEYFGGKL